MKESLHYISEVLGVRELLIEDEQNASSIEGSPFDQNGSASGEVNFEYLVDEKTQYSFRHIPTHLIINFDNDPANSIFVEPQKELFQKMISALKIGVQQRLALQVRGVGVDEMLRDLAQKIKTPMRILVLSNDPSRLPEEKLGLHIIFQTFSPSILLQRPELKRTAWETMQRFQIN